MITAGDIRKGVIFDDGTSTDPKKPSLFLVVDFQHVKPGKVQLLFVQQSKTYLQEKFLKELITQVKKSTIFKLKEKK